MGQLPGKTGLVSDFCTSNQQFVYGFLQIPNHSGHPCLRLWDSGHNGSQGTCGNSHAPIRFTTCPAHQILSVRRTFLLSNIFIRLSKRVFKRQSRTIFVEKRCADDSRCRALKYYYSEFFSSPYKKAPNNSIEQLQVLPLSMRVLKQSHKSYYQVFVARIDYQEKFERVRTGLKKQVFQMLFFILQLFLRLML